MNPIDETDDTEAPESAFSPLPKLNFYRPSYRSPERAEIVRDSAEIALRSQDFFSSVTLSIPFDTLKQKKESSSLDFLITFDDFSNPQNPQEPQWATLRWPTGVTAPISPRAPKTHRSAPRALLVVLGTTPAPKPTTIPFPPQPPHPCPKQPSKCGKYPQPRHPCVPLTVATQSAASHA